jgi:hypothetical protein
VRVVLRRQLGVSWSWLLGGLLAVLVVAAAGLDREAWPGFVGDEATYLMAAESLAWDGDYLYERRDYDRFTRHWGSRPELLLFLQSNDRGRTLVYAKPLFYPLAAAPLTRLFPLHGPLLTNALLLAVAALLATRALRPFLDREAPLWMATFLFASVAFAYALWAHADVFLMSLVAIALSLALPADRIDNRATRGDLARWLAVGALTGIVAFSRPFYATIALPLALALPRGRRLPTGSAMALGAALVIVPAAALHWHLAGAFTSYTGERGGFYADRGLPEVDFEGEAWDEAIRRSGNFSWYTARQPLADFADKLDPGLWGWNFVYFLTGRHVGLLPYYLPVVLGLALVRPDRLRLGLLLALAAATLAFFFYRPFNFFGGGAAIGNRYFLPLYPAVWFLVARRPARRVRILAPLAVALAATPFLWPLWTDVGSYPLTREQTYEFVGAPALALLPYETTQSHLKQGGQEDVIHNGIWVRVLSPGTRVDDERIWSRGGSWSELLVAGPGVLKEITIAGPRLERGRLELGSGRLLEEQRRGEVTLYRVAMPEPRARHSMWWSWDPLTLYRLRFRFTGVPSDEVVGSYLELPREPRG